MVSSRGPLEEGVVLDVQDDPGRTWTLTVDISRDLAKVHNQLLKTSLAYFAKHMLGMQVSNLHVEWSEMCSKNQRLALLAARDHGKSAFWSYAYPVWQAWRKPGSLGYVISCQTTLAEELLAIIREGNSTLKGLVHHSRLRYLVDERKNWTKRQIKLTNGSIIRARGYGTRLRGGHPDWIVCDDVLDESSMYSTITREKSKSYFRSAIVNMALKTGQIAVVGTPFHADDLYAWLRKNEAYAFECFPGLIQDNNEPLAPDGSGKRYRALYPDRHSVADLLKKKIEIGSVDFAREILCQPITDDLTLFPTTLFVGEVMDHQLSFGLSLQELKDRGWNTFVGVDFAISASSAADYTVITVLAEDYNGNKYLIDSARLHGAGFQEQKSAILDFNARYQPGLIVVESNAMQAIFGDELIRESDAPIKKFHTGESKNSLMKGVPSLRTLLENKKLRFARGDDVSIDATNKYIEELQQFGFVGGRVQGIGSHDDCVMSLWLAVQATKLGGFKFSIGGDHADGPEQAQPTTPAPTGIGFGMPHWSRLIN